LLDITERKKATEDLKANKALTTSNATLRKSELSLVKSNDTFSKLFDNNPCGISICTKEGQIYLKVLEIMMTITSKGKI
jgi:hypothetical protein